MAFGFSDIVTDASYNLLGPLGTMYSVYRATTRDRKDYEQFAQDAHKALYYDSDGRFNPLKATMHTVSPIMAAYTLWNETGKDKRPNPYGRTVNSASTYYNHPPAVRPAIGV